MTVLLDSWAWIDYYRDSEKVVRGVKKSNSPLIEGYEIYHNYIRPHMGLDGKTPSEAYGIEVSRKQQTASTQLERN